MEKIIKLQLNKLIPLVVLFFILAPVWVYADSSADSDKDGLVDRLETKYHTDIYNKDTDGDGYSDMEEISSGYSPHTSTPIKFSEFDYDNDGLSNGLEFYFGSDMGKKDTDGDGYSDFEEVMSGHSPTSVSSELVYDRKLLVDKNNQRLKVIVDSKTIKNYPVSTGLTNMPTPSGDFEVQRKLPVAVYSGDDYYYPGVEWSLQFKPRYYIHGAYWHDQFGIKPMSHGCVNMQTKDAKVLYKYFDVGADVEIVGDTPRGPVKQT